MSTGKICPYCNLGLHEECLRAKGRECVCEECRAPTEDIIQWKYVYGLDPASKNDFTGCTIHAIGNYTEGQPYLPELRDLFEIRFLPFDKQLEKLQREYFVKYPPSLIVTDYTNEKTFTDLLVRSYPENMIMPITFSESSKLMLKEDGLSILNQGYRFPNWTKIADPQKAEWIMKLEKQMQAEQLLTTPKRKQHFDHPSGEHNDLAISWELSIHGCMQIILKKGSIPVIESVGREDNPDLRFVDDVDLFPELNRFKIDSFSKF